MQNSKCDFDEYNIELKNYEKHNGSRTEIYAYINGLYAGRVEYQKDDLYCKGIWITNVFVEKEYRKKGIATKMLKQLIQDNLDCVIGLNPAPYERKTDELDEDILKKIYDNIAVKGNKLLTFKNMDDFYAYKFELINTKKRRKKNILKNIFDRFKK